MNPLIKSSFNNSIIGYILSKFPPISIRFIFFKFKRYSKLCSGKSFLNFKSFIIIKRNLPFILSLTVAWRSFRCEEICVIIILFSPSLHANSDTFTHHLFFCTILRSFPFKYKLNFVFSQQNVFKYSISYDFLFTNNFS